MIGDGHRLKQVLVNLMSNSIKFTPKGHVAMFANCKDKVDRLSVQISVQDTGIGMTEEQQKKLFKPFIQAEATTQRKFGGTGLGLSISKELVKLMGGSITVQSELGQGSQFIVNLEFVKCDTWTSDNFLPVPARKNFVVCLENHVMRQVVVQELKESGIDVICQTDSISKLLTSAEGGIQLESMPDLAQKPPTTSDEARDWAILLETKPTKEFQALVSKLTDFGFAVLVLCSDKKSATKLVRVVQQPFSTHKLRDALSKPILTSPSLSKSSSVSHASKLCILVVEDNLMNNKLAKMMLEKLGHQVFSAFNGVEAIELWKSMSFDIILMDNSMPEMDGITCTKKIRETDQSTPIIAFTASVFSSELKLCFDAGMNDHLPKPFLKANLENILQKYAK